MQLGRWGERGGRNTWATQMPSTEMCTDGEGGHEMLAEWHKGEILMVMRRLSADGQCDGDGPCRRKHGKEGRKCREGDTWLCRVVLVVLVKKQQQKLASYVPERAVAVGNWSEQSARKSGGWGLLGCQYLVLGRAHNQNTSSLACRAIHPKPSPIFSCS